MGNTLRGKPMLANLRPYARSAVTAVCTRLGTHSYGRMQGIRALLLRPYARACYVLMHAPLLCSKGYLVETHSYVQMHAPLLAELLEMQQVLLGFPITGDLAEPERYPVNLATPAPSLGRKRLTYERKQRLNRYPTKPSTSSRAPRAKPSNNLRMDGSASLTVTQLRGDSGLSLWIAARGGAVVGGRS